MTEEERKEFEGERRYFEGKSYDPPPKYMTEAEARRELDHKLYAIDFDGTIVRHEYPYIGELNQEAVDFIHALQKRVDKWILLTMREGVYLDHAVNFCKEHGLYPSAVNDNVDYMQVLFDNNPRKIYADVYIDDHNAGGLRWEN